jgi:hypothetical protein
MLPRGLWGLCVAGGVADAGRDRRAGQCSLPVSPSVVACVVVAFGPEVIGAGLAAADVATRECCRSLRSRSGNGGRHCGG